MRILIVTLLTILASVTGCGSDAGTEQPSPLSAWNDTAMKTDWNAVFADKP